MSPWWKAPTALLEPGRATLAGAVREAGDGWRGALAALDALLGERREPRLRLVLSNHFVRYLVVPPDPAVTGAAERRAYFGHHFAQVYGERAAGWSVAAPRARGEACLAAAVDAALLVEARALAARRRVSLLGAKPLAVVALNRERRHLGGTPRFFAVLEPGRACLLLVGAERVLQVANRRCNDPRGELEALVALEALEAGYGPAERLPVSIAEPLAA